MIGKLALSIVLFLSTQVFSLDAAAGREIDDPQRLNIYGVMPFESDETTRYLQNSPEIQRILQFTTAQELLDFIPNLTKDPQLTQTFFTIDLPNLPRTRNNRVLMGLFLVEAIKQQHRQTVQLLLQHGVDPNVYGKDGNAPLHWAARMCNPEVAHVLVNRGADINALNGEGKTALQIAQENNCTEVGELIENFVLMGDIRNLRVE